MSKKSHGTRAIAACAPGRRERLSKTLGRSTCLTSAEESAALAKGLQRTDLTDADIAQKLRLKDVLRPSMPKEWLKNPHTWLSDIDIDSAMKQYARLVPEFEYLGTMPVDFAETDRMGGCVRMCSHKPFESVYKNRKLGASVVNLDVHTGRGTHWVAIALDCRGHTPRLMYYDSTGRRPPRRWMNAVSPYARILAAIPHRDVRMRVLKNAVYNRRTHQRQNTECGVFAMMFIDALISGRSFEKHCARALKDDDAFRHRSIFFEPVRGTDAKRAVTWSNLLAR